jgi:anthranilate synthase component 2
MIPHLPILLVDNHDSFTYNLYHLFDEIEGVTLRVKKLENVSCTDLLASKAVIASPGPGLPVERPALLEMIKWVIQTKPFLGVCLGHQALAMAVGGHLTQLDTVRHGITSSIRIVSEQACLFRGIDQFYAGRYHSWVVDKSSLPKCLEITATDEEGQIMAIRHKLYPSESVQFHPESFMTEAGNRMARNFAKLVSDYYANTNNPALIKG